MAHPTPEGGRDPDGTRKVGTRVLFERVDFTEKVRKIVWY